MLQEVSKNEERPVPVPGIKLPSKQNAGTLRRAVVVRKYHTKIGERGSFRLSTGLE